MFSTSSGATDRERSWGPFSASCLAGPGDPAAPKTDCLPLLPSGPGGVHRVLLHRARPLIQAAEYARELIKPKSHLRCLSARQRPRSSRKVFYPVAKTCVMAPGTSEHIKPKSHLRCLSARINYETAMTSGRFTRSAVWRRGWAFDVALARLLALLLRGPAPSYAPHEGTHPLHNPCSNPTLSKANTQGVYPVAFHHEAPGRASSVWRRGWDSNPRSRYRDACFPSMSIRPLSHLSASVEGRILACAPMSGKAR